MNKNTMKLILTSLALLIFFFLLFPIAKRQIRLSKNVKIAESLYDRLPFPDSLSLIDKNVKGYIYKYNKNCAKVEISALYQSNNSFEELSTEQDKLLIAQGWIPNPDFVNRHEVMKNYSYLPQNDRYLPSFRLYLFNEPIGDREFNLRKLGVEKNTLYYVLLIYYDPSYFNCAG